MLFLALISTLIVGVIVGIFVERKNADRIEKLLNTVRDDAKKVSDTANAVKNDVQKL